MQKLCTPGDAHWLYSNHAENQLFKCEFRETINLRLYVALDYYFQKGGHQSRAHGHPFSVSCDIIDKNGVRVAILSHDSSEDITLVYV